jgi:DNA-binding XRE family transcriptional regulator
MDEVTHRISLVINYLRLSKTEFADKIEVNRSVISHLFNGRNNPTLPLIRKILEVVPEVHPDWLLRGEGPMLRPSSPLESLPLPAPAPMGTSQGKAIERIMVFYADGTFQQYTPHGG